MSRKKQVYEKITALYCRISLDDGGDNESMSISNQKLMLRDFAEKHGMFQYEYYVDDGYTGRNFNRPAFQRMIADIEAGKVGCVVTKDLSRLGRNYIEAGSYIEIFFPKHNVRYIAVTDGVDSLTRQEMDITPFKNILNDMYSRDISKKVLAGRMTRSRQGKFCGGQPPLGLMRDPEDKGHLILDPETAPVIRKIYDMALDGWGCMRIAKQLMDDKVPITRVKSNTECDVNMEVLKKERSEFIQDQTADFQLNEMLLQLSEERFSDKKIGKIEVYRIEDGSTVTFDNVFSENGVKKSIRCSNILIRIMRNEE